MRDKRERNERLLKFAEAHPEYTQQALAGIFHMDRTRVSRILKKMTEQKPEVVISQARVNKFLKDQKPEVVRTHGKTAIYDV